MLAKRIAVALDVKDGRVVKGVQFKDMRDAGDPVELAVRYENEGSDEIVFLDISASRENRGTIRQLSREVSSSLSIPFTVGGGIRSAEDARDLIRNGADKIFVNTAAIERKGLIREISDVVGSSNTIVAIDCRFNGRFYEVYSHGGRTPRGIDAIAWASEAQNLGAGELLVTSMDADGTEKGYDLNLIGKLSENVSIPVIASGGAGTPEHFLEVFRAGADAALGASVFHYGKFSVSELKKYLERRGIIVRKS
jgi:cyclase